MKKNKIMLCLCLALAFACVLAGCFGSGDKILAEDSYTCEYGEIFTIPYVYATTGAEATVVIYDAEGYEVPIEYGTCSLELGEYKMFFTAGELTKEVPLYCVDTKAPSISITYTSSAAVGHWYTLPKVNVSDISTVDKARTTVELYKAGEITPVASASGSRVRIEDAPYYILKVSAADKMGNIAYVEKQITVVTRPESEVLQDFSEEVNPYWENTWGAGIPAFQWLEEYEGKQGVIAMGVDGSNSQEGYGYAWWTSLGMDEIDLVGATGFTFKVRAENCRLLSLKPSFSGSTIQVYGSHVAGIPYTPGEWVEVYISLVNNESAFSDMSKATVAFSVAPDAFYKDVCVWIDEIIVHYAPYEEYTLTVEDGSYNYTYDTIPDGRRVTVTHDDSKTPEGKAFSHYLCNGQRVWGNTVTVTENSVLTPVYVDLVTEEKAIPEGAVLVTDFSNKGKITGSRQHCITEWYETYEGVAGVVSIGLTEHNGYVLPEWTGIIPAAFNFDPYTHVTFRMMVKKDALSCFGLANDEEVLTDLLTLIPEGDMAWVDVKIPVSELNSLYIGLNNIDGQTGEKVWIDQIFVTIE